MKSTEGKLEKFVNDRLMDFDFQGYFDQQTNYTTE